MRMQPTSEQERAATASKEETATNRPRAGRAPSKRTSPVAEARPETARPEKAQARDHQPRPRKEESRGRKPTRFSFRAPDAQNVAVAGSFNGWQPATQLIQRDGEWVCEVDLDPGTYEYRFVVDGQWIEDPRASAHATNPYGGRNSVIKV